MFNEEMKQICRSFSILLDYPGPALPGEARNCVRQLERSFPRQAEAVAEFADFVESQRPAALEELYTQTFDLTPASSLYLGYHLFGETPKRSALLVGLQEAYQSCGFSGGIELADHLGVILRFLAVTEDAEFTVPLLQECVLPTLPKTEEALRQNDSQYALVIGAVRTFLRLATGKIDKAGGVQNA